MVEKDVEFAIKNARKAIDLIPISLLNQEERLLSRTKASKKSPLVKLGDLYSFMHKIAQPFQHLTPCKKGCNSCCHIRVDVSELEVLYIKKHAQKATRSLQKGLVVGDPCPFLKNGGCSIYEARPFHCRRHQVFTPDNRLCALDSEVNLEQLAFSEIDKSFAYIVLEHGNSEFAEIRTIF